MRIHAIFSGAFWGHCMTSILRYLMLNESRRLEWLKFQCGTCCKVVHGKEAWMPILKNRLSCRTTLMRSLSANQTSPMCFLMAAWQKVSIAAKYCPVYQLNHFNTHCCPPQARLTQRSRSMKSWQHGGRYYFLITIFLDDCVSKIMVSNNLHYLRQ